jgi:hypothetical protein
LDQWSAPVVGSAEKAELMTGAFFIGGEGFAGK